MSHVSFHYDLSTGISDGLDAFFIHFIIMLCRVADCQLELETGCDIWVRSSVKLIIGYKGIQNNLVSLRANFVSPSVSVASKDGPIKSKRISIFSPEVYFYHY